MKQSPLPPLYLITDRRLIRPEQNFFEVLEQLMVTGVRMIQLREKDLPAQQLYDMAQHLRTITLRHNCLLLINDRVDIALAVNADGVHLRSRSLPTAVARQLLGKEKLIGVSTHSTEEVTTAADQGADFATYGPVFYTPSKASYGAPKGLSELQEACRASALPMYALGGITVTNTPAVMTTGTHGAAVISSLLTAKNPTSVCKKLIDAIGHC
ncbi:thiamine phosphate synthase [Pelovirga terrestris]|uniref:Thiamine-phosphate synthase n=1 Tax=Pelovirga terrestris TaxID=2771352 RepID=A0A8J6QWA5_9BACT|nr:thiamine phosphate synthase [Pelovirga terrestris]MBD1399498.1 thiamine phosphate synthase [Pelovirga terrestris]